MLVGLDGGGHYQDAVFRARQIQGHQFHCARAKEAGFAHQPKLAMAKPPLRETEHPAWFAGQLLQDLLGGCDFRFGHFIGKLDKLRVVNGVGAYFKLRTERSNGPGIHHGAFRVFHRNIKGSPQAVLGEQLRHSEIRWLSVIPTRRKQRFSANHGTCLPNSTSRRRQIFPARRFINRAPSKTRAWDCRQLTEEAWRKQAYAKQQCYQFVPGFLTPYSCESNGHARNGSKQAASGEASLGFLCRFEDLVERIHRVQHALHL